MPLKFNFHHTISIRRVNLRSFSILFLWLILCGCGAIGTKDVGFRKAYEQINTNALLDEQYSVTSKNVLQRYNMGVFFREHPLECLNELHKKTLTDNRRDLLFALAELNYFTAKYTLRDLDDSPLPETRQYYLNAAVYAYFYLSMTPGTSLQIPLIGAIAWHATSTTLPLPKR